MKTSIFLTSIIVITSFFVATVGAQFVYDPVTNSYVPVGTSQQTSPQQTTSPPTTNDPSVVPSSITASSTTVASGSTSDSGATTTETSSTQTTTTPIVSTYTLPDPEKYQGSLSAMHIQLDMHIKTVMDKLATHTNSLDVSKSASLQQAAERLTMLTCLNIISSTTNVYDILQSSATNLQTSIAIVTTDMHAQISALEEKIAKGLLDKLVQQLEISSMQNKIDSFLNEYTNVVDLFFEVSIGEVAAIENLFTNLSPQAKKDLATYTETMSAYESVMRAYEEFLSKASFANVVAGPHLHELISLTNGLKTYRRSVALTERQKHIGNYMPIGTQGVQTEQKKLFAQDFSLLFNQTSQQILGNLYPIDELLVLNQQIMGIRSSYTNQTNGLLDCRSFVENPTVSIIGPELEKYMTTLLGQLNTAVNQVTTNQTLPQTKDELLDGLQHQMAQQANEMIKTLISQHRTKTSTALEAAGRQLLSVSTPGSTSKLETAVRVYLQTRYIDALEKKTLNAFQQQMISVISKIDTLISSGNVSTSQARLLMTIETIVNEFLQ